LKDWDDNLHLVRDTAEESPELYKFEISGRDGIYHAEWPNLHIGAKVNMVHRSSNHEVHAMVTFHSNRPMSAGHIKYGRLNITSVTARKSFAKECEARENSVDWDQVLEVLGISILDRFWAGTEAVELSGDLSAVEVDAKWLVNPLIQVNNITTIYGQGGIGKSWIAQFIAVLVGSGTSVAGFHVEPGNVLYCDWETTELELNARISMLRRGLGHTGNTNIWYKRMYSSLEENIEAVKELVVDKNISLIIIDSVAAACMGDSETSAAATGLYNSINSLSVSSLCIHHDNKKGELFGSAYHYHRSRLILEVEQKQEPQAHTFFLGAFNRKANNTAILQDMTFEVTILKDEGTATIKKVDIRDTPLEEHMRNADRIANALRRGGLTVSELAERLDKTESHIRNLLSQYSKMFYNMGKNAEGFDRYANIHKDFTPQTYDGGIEGWDLKPEA
tara:strand:+ start:137 stop:1480 length:1344 start_codon:yes stop_codon:yes gene_type:complete